VNLDDEQYCYEIIQKRTPLQRLKKKRWRCFKAFESDRKWTPPQRHQKEKRTHADTASYRFKDMKIKRTPLHRFQKQAPLQRTATFFLELAPS